MMTRFLLFHQTQDTTSVTLINVIRRGALIGVIDRNAR
jgi:hypothetical protein